MRQDLLLELLSTSSIVQTAVIGEHKIDRAVRILTTIFKKVKHPPAADSPPSA